jgi:hypothetical protein
MEFILLPDIGLGRYYHLITRPKRHDKKGLKVWNNLKTPGDFIGCDPEHLPVQEE